MSARAWPGLDGLGVARWQPPRGVGHCRRSLTGGPLHAASPRAGGSSRGNLAPGPEQVTQSSSSSREAVLSGPHPGSLTPPLPPHSVCWSHQVQATPKGGSRAPQGRHASRRNAHSPSHSGPFLTLSSECTPLRRTVWGPCSLPGSLSQGLTPPCHSPSPWRGAWHVAGAWYVSAVNGSGMLSLAHGGESVRQEGSLPGHVGFGQSRVGGTLRWRRVVTWWGQRCVMGTSRRASLVSAAVLSPGPWGSPDQGTGTLTQARWQPAPFPGPEWEEGPSWAHRAHGGEGAGCCARQPLLPACQLLPSDWLPPGRGVSTGVPCPQGFASKEGVEVGARPRF